MPEYRQLRFETVRLIGDDVDCLWGVVVDFPPVELTCELYEMWEQAERRAHEWKEAGFVAQLISVPREFIIYRSIPVEEAKQHD